MSDQFDRLDLFDDEDRDALFDLLLEEEGLLDDEQPTTIQPRTWDGPVPLTFAQSRVWFLEQMAAEPTAVFNIPTAIRIAVPVDADLLEQSINLIVERHESLRTRIVQMDGKPFQWVEPFQPLRLPQIDLSGHQNGHLAQATDTFLQTEAERPFILTEAPLFRVCLAKESDSSYLFTLTMHHIISDGWSINRFLDEMVTAYDSLRRHQPVRLPELVVQYADFAMWQSEQITSQTMQQQLAYWRDKLAAPRHITELPPDFARPTEQVFDGASVMLHLSPAQTAALNKLSQREGVTLFMTLLAAFKLMLHKMTAQDDILVGSPMAGRSRTELEPLIGFFLNSLVLRTDLSGDPSFRSLLKRIYATCTEAYANQEIPFEHLLAELKPERDPSRTPFFQIFFNMLNFADGLDEAETELPYEHIAEGELAAKFDLTIYAEETETGLYFDFVYNRQLYLPERMQALVEQYTAVLDQIVAQPDQPLSRFLLPAPSAAPALPNPRARLSDQWEGAIHDRVSHWAEVQPDKTAVQDATHAWTYAELEQWSNRLAHHLIAQGVKPGDVTVIYAQRTASLVWAVISALKAGTAIVVLDPTYPPGRLARYINVAQPKSWLQLEAAGDLDADLQTVVDQVAVAQVVLPEKSDLTDWSALATQPDTPPAVAIGPNSPACLTFTSGSSGLPKGVVGRHGSLTHFYPWMTETFSLTADDRFSMLSGLAHDPLQRDMFTPLWVGATIMVPDGEKMFLPGWLARWMRQQRISIAHMTPAMGQLVIETQEALEIPSLRFALFVGESLSRRRVAQLHGLAPNVTAVNLYGSTESQRAVSYHLVDNHPQAAGRLKQIIQMGKGMPDAQVLVLNPYQQMAGVGEVGELYMRSPHISLGYLDDPELTAEKYVVNPFTRDPADRLYRTGDLGRYLPNGEVEFFGRKDKQVNIRGFRVELGEIESVLSQHPAVKDALVKLYQPADQNQPRIAAYVTLHEPLETAVLRDFMRRQLPGHMVPTVFILLDSMPMTPNAKIDHDALPAPETAETASDTFEPPQTETEKAVAEVWQTLLSVPRVGANSDFFELGGHSLVAVQMFSRLRHQFGIDLSLAMLFKTSTVRLLAAHIDSRLQVAQTAVSAQPVAEPRAFKSLINVHDGSDHQPVFYCVHGAGGNILFMQEWKKYLGDLSLVGFQARGVDGVTPMHQSIEAMAADYVEELLHVQPEGPYYLSGYSGGGVIAYEMAQQLIRQGHEMGLLILIDTFHPSIQPRNFSVGEKMQALLSSPLEYLENVFQHRVKDRIDYDEKVHTLTEAGTAVPIELREEVLVAQFRKIRAEYDPQPYDGQVLLLNSDEIWAIYDHVPPAKGWDQVIADLSIETIHGDHFTIIREPNLPGLVQRIRRHIIGHEAIVTG